MKTEYKIQNFYAEKININCIVVFNYKDINVVDNHFTSVIDSSHRIGETCIVGQFRITKKHKN